MDLRRLQAQQVGQIDNADIRFGDLTILVGPQATGKSIFLQLLKLVVDTGYVLQTLTQYGLHWERGLADFLDIYLGEGMRSVWQESKSRLIAGGETIDLAALVKRQRVNKSESLFFVPAQRVLTLSTGWPRPFADYSPGDPFSVRDFSEKLRRLMEQELGRADDVFPQVKRLKSEIRNHLVSAVFTKFGLRIDKHGPQKRLVLCPAAGGPALPFMVWSAGQREFVPLLLAYYWLMPPTRVVRRADIEWVVIEELEMGLHPQAISVTLLLVLELLARGYRVCLSTHSQHVLDVVWALKHLQKSHSDARKLLELFAVAATAPMLRLAEEVLKKDARVYVFDGSTGRTKDISNLDPGASDEAEAGWGGLSEFSGRVADVVASVVSNGKD